MLVSARFTWKLHLEPGRHQAWDHLDLNLDDVAGLKDKILDKKSMHGIISLSRCIGIFGWKLRNANIFLRKKYSINVRDPPNIPINIGRT